MVCQALELNPQCAEHHQCNTHKIIPASARLQSAACSISSWLGNNIYGNCGISADLRQKNYHLQERSLSARWAIPFAPAYLELLPRSNLNSHANIFLHKVFFCGAEISSGSAWLMQFRLYSSVAWGNGGNWQLFRKHSLPWSGLPPFWPSLP